MYVLNYHPTTADVPLWVGGAMVVETLLVSYGKWVSARGEMRLGDMIQQAASEAGQAVLDAGRRNDPKVPVSLPPMPDLSEPVPLPEKSPIPALQTTPDPDWLVAP